jgi:hypothetical protein
LFHDQSTDKPRRNLDPSRPINDNCGWEHVLTDLTTFHDYADAPLLTDRSRTVESITTTGRSVFLPPLTEKQGEDYETQTDPGSAHLPNAPILCTEFGGVNITSDSSDQQQQQQHEDGWGYTTASNASDLLDRFAALCHAVVLAGHICGFVYTQTSDIEQETNGLLTYDRKPKLPLEDVKRVVEKAARTYLDQAAKTAKRRAVVFRGGLADGASVRDLKIEEGRWLVGECAVNSQGDEWRASRLDLNDCFVNSWGKVTWAKGGNFVASCREVGLREGSTVMEVEAGDRRSWQRNAIRLEERVGNVGGELAFA